MRKRLEEKEAVVADLSKELEKVKKLKILFGTNI